MLEIIKNLPTRLIDCDQGLQDDPVSQMLWLIVASAAGSLVYHIPDCKSYLASRAKKCTVPFGLPESKRLRTNENARPRGRALLSGVAV
ncbi:hypothetical protein [Bradyrhizobium sp. SEMIA]|uniref:hypothetical protein n=1 Tax=Bradyrhizobium sp. SEMIA TaxID=2597515 RepID=UPI0018A4ECF7|nr:hypothetical protein [Bradyrhizobium sp. SEMIA]QOG20171.1 hypothetical protein FOM02_25290 [Bradyrhizobium sp. SEMIA]